LGFSFIVRSLCAYRVFGPQALDDYINNIRPLRIELLGGKYDFPAWRSPLLEKTLFYFVKLARAIFQNSSAVFDIRASYFVLGLLSLLGVWGAYLYSSRKGEDRFQKLALGFFSLHGLLPFVTTRALGESLALSLMVLGVGLLESPRTAHKTGRWGGALVLGLAVLFRFQAGIFYVAYAVTTALARRKREFAALMGTGILLILIQSAMDSALGRTPLGTLRAYFGHNGDPAVYGKNPWYATWFAWLFFIYFPLCVPFVRSLRKFWKRHWVSFAPVLVFLLVHSWVPHKEERFIYPVAGFAILYGAWFASEVRKWNPALKIWAGLIVVLNSILFVLTSFTNTQVGVVEPLAFASSRTQKAIIFDRDSRMSDSLFWQIFLPESPAPIRLQGTPELQAHLEKNADFSSVLFTSGDRISRADLEILQAYSYRCRPPQEAASCVDRAIYSMNPRRNRRRKPAWWTFCEKK
jgi:hypothetical protein